MPKVVPTSKELANFRKSEIGKLRANVETISKSEKEEEMLMAVDSAMSALIKLKESGKGKIHTDWLSSEPK